MLLSLQAIIAVCYYPCTFVIPLCYYSYMLLCLYVIIFVYYYQCMLLSLYDIIPLCYYILAFLSFLLSNMLPRSTE